MSTQSKSKSKRDFGSFHSSNVQELLSIPDADYIAPNIPIELPSFGHRGFEGWEDAAYDLDTSLVFGHKARKDFFLLEEQCCFLNHGAFGAVLKQAMEAAQKWQMYTERQPLRFYDRELLPLLVLVSRKLAKFVDCDPRDLVLVNNATYGTNSVLGSLSLGPKDVILTFNITYGAVKKLVQHVCSLTGAKNREACIDFPLKGPEQITGLLEKELSQDDVSLVIVDHIPSNTPFIMPVREMVRICHQRKVKIFVDGAHALGSISLSLSTLDPDFYVSNAHKWFCCPKGAAFLYVKREHQCMIRPAVVSHGHGSGFNSEFVWSGLHDYSPMLALLTIIEFWHTMGEQKIRDYMHSTVRDAAKLLMRSWNSQLAAPMEMFASMALIELPQDIQSSFTTIGYSAAEDIQNSLYHQFNIEVPVKCVQGKLYVRISAHLYNELSDYEKLAKAILMIEQKKGNKLL